MLIHLQKIQLLRLHIYSENNLNNYTQEICTESLLLNQYKI